MASPVCPTCGEELNNGRCVVCNPPGMFRAGTVLDGKWRIEKRIGRGGMGAVYLATDLALDRPVAVKILSQGFSDPDTLARFDREAKTLARIEHPSFVPVHAVARDGDIPYLVMKFVKGRTLSELATAEGGRLPIDRMLELLRPLCDALDYLHGMGLVHRDIKPSNVMLSDDGQLTVLDMGVVNAWQGQNVTGTGHMVGTPQFMAPEQIEHPSGVDARADVYSLGATVWTLLSGESLFAVGSQTAVVAAQLITPARQLSAVLPGAPAEVSQVLDRALAKDPADRYASAGELYRALVAAAGRARSRSQAFAVPKYRKATWVALGLLGALVFVLGLVVAKLAQKPEPAARIPVLLTVATKPPLRVRIRPAEQNAMPIDLGTAPLDRVSGAFVGDTVLLSDEELGLAEEEVISSGAAGEEKRIERTFAQGELLIETKPPRTDLAVYRGEHRVGRTGDPFALYEGEYHVEVRGEGIAPQRLDGQISKDVLTHVTVDLPEAKAPPDDRSANVKAREALVNGDAAQARKLLEGCSDDSCARLLAQLPAEERNLAALKAAGAALTKDDAATAYRRLSEVKSTELFKDMRAELATEHQELVAKLLIAESLPQAPLSNRMQVSKEPEANELYNKARGQMADGQLQAAKFSLQDCVEEVRPVPVECRRLLGAVLLRLNQTGQAVNEYAAFLKAAPKHKNAAAIKALLEQVTVTARKAPRERDHERE